MTASLDRAPKGPLVPVPIAQGGWFAASITLEADDHLRIVFHERGSSDQLEVVLLPRDAPGPVLRRLARCAVRYSVRLKDASPERRAQAGAIVMGVATAIDERLQAGASSIADALGRDKRARKMVFGRESLRALLAPEITEGVPLADGWTLHDVYPTSHVRHAVGDRLELVVEFRRADLRRLRFAVLARDDDQAAWIRTPHFNVMELKGATSEPEDAQALRALFGFVLQLRDHEELEVVFPDVLADLAIKALPAPAEERRDLSLNLALDADCAQSCEFCSIKELTPPYDGDETVLRRAITDLDGARARGITHLRLNGYDPLAYSRVLDVLDRARELGFDRLDVFSPATRLADRAFASEVIARTPESRAFFVPLYGADSELHDRVVGRPGAFALVTRALDNLVELAGPGAVRILTVATRSNLAALADIERFAKSRGIVWWAHLPYPSYESKSDKFFEATPKQEAAAEAGAAFYARRETRVFPIRGVAPCVSFRTLGPRGVAPWQWLGIERRPLPGTEYASKPIEHGEGVRTASASIAATVPCVHAKDCALATECGGELLRGYVERYGAEEFAPVSLGALMAACAPKT